MNKVLGIKFVLFSKETTLSAVGDFVGNIYIYSLKDYSINSLF